MRAQLAAIVDSSFDAIVSKTLDGVITFWNHSAERLFGYTAAEAVGQSIFLIIPPDRKAEEEEVLARLRRGEPIEHFETIRRTKDGRRLPISLTISPIRDARGRIIGASKSARDITERLLAEEALRRAHDELEEGVRERTAELTFAFMKVTGLRRRSSPTFFRADSPTGNQELSSRLRRSVPLC